MKILYIADGNGLNPGIGGSLTRTVEIAKRLKRMGHEIHFLTTSGGLSACRSRGLDAEYHLLPASLFGKEEEKNISDRMLSYLISTVYSFREMKELPRCDIVYTDSDYFCDVLPAVLYKKIFKTRWAAMTHHRIGIRGQRAGDIAVRLFSSRLQMFCFYMFRKFADRIFVYDSEEGDAIAGIMTNIGIPPLKIEKVANGVDTESVRKIPKGKVRYDACFVGGLRPEKGLYDIIPIWKGVVGKRKGSVLIIIGGMLKGYENELKSQIEESGLRGNVILARKRSHDDVIRIMKMSRLLISPSREEGWGIAICEAMACGLPAIAWDLPVYRRVFGDGIISSDIGDIEDFSKNILNVLCNRVSTKALVSKNHKAVMRYDWDRIAKREEEIFASLAKTRDDYYR